MRTAGHNVVVKNLNWSFGDKKILKDISLCIEKDKLYSVIGPNGSGKTTLLRIISRMLKADKGCIFVKNKDLSGLKNREIARMISCVPQNTNIDFDFSVMDIVLMGRSPYLKRLQTENREDIDIARSAMIATNTWHLRDKNINKISGGERQRVIVSRALAQEADIMLLDEPASQLDIHHQVELMDTIRQMIVKRHVTAICVMHDLNLAAQYSDYMVLLNEGEIVCHGTAETVLTRENIESVYNMQVNIIKNPVTGKPLIIPMSCIRESSVAG